MRQSGDICLYMSFAHAVRLRGASAYVQQCSVRFLHILWVFVFTKTTPNMKIFQLSSGACCICVDYWLHLPKFALWHWFKRFITEQSLLLQYVQELEVMKYFYSLISWMSALAVKWIILKSPFGRLIQKGRFFVITHIRASTGKHGSPICKIMETVLASKE